MTEDLIKIRDRVKKLLSLGNNAGATEFEAAQALQMASDLMARYNIQIDSSTNQDDRAVVQGQKYPFDHPWQKIAAMAAGTLYNCQIITWGNEYINFVGRSHNIDAARDTHLWIMDQIERFYKQALTPGLSKSERAEFRRTFKFSCANRVYFRASAIVEERKSVGNTKAVEQTGSTALVVVKSIIQQIEEVAAFIHDMENVRTERTVRYKMGSGTRAGRDAGDNVQLNRALK